MLLADGERNVSSLCGELSLRQPTVSHHLKLLKLGHMILSSRRGKEMFYTLNQRVCRYDPDSVRCLGEHFRLEVTSSR